MYRRLWERAGRTLLIGTANGARPPGDRHRTHRSPPYQMERSKTGPAPCYCLCLRAEAASLSYLHSAENPLPKWQQHHLPRIALRGRQFSVSLYIDWQYNMQLIQFFLMDLDFQSSGEMKANFIFDGLLGGLQQLLPETGVLKGPRGKVRFQFLPLGLFRHKRTSPSKGSYFWKG